jgi:hypothetical protein
VREASVTWSIPAEVVESDPRDSDAWRSAMTAAVQGLLEM